MPRNQGFSTRLIHCPFAREDANRALHQPIYSNAAYGFNSAEQMESAFRGQVPMHSYSRITNPTVENFELRIKHITDASHVTALSSGMAAISNVIFVLASAGSNIVASKHLFGNTLVLFESTIRDFDIEVRFCDLTKSVEVARQIDGKTIAVFAETITNPQLEVIDLAGLSRIAHEHNVPLIADSTLTPPNILKAKEIGVDLEVISSTKCISGGATSVGGLIIDYGNFDWNKAEKLATLAKNHGNSAFNYKLRQDIFRNFGACMSPYTAYLQSLGLETLQLRFEKAAQNCIGLAKFLETLPNVKSVNYPGLNNSPFYEISKRQFGKYPGAILCFDLETKEDCFSFINKLKIIRRATNIYDNKSLIIHPASTIFCDMDKARREDIGVHENTLRLSAGIEELEDLKDDIRNAFT